MGNKRNIDLKADYGKNRKRGGKDTLGSGNLKGGCGDLGGRHEPKSTALADDYLRGRRRVGAATNCKNGEK